MGSRAEKLREIGVGNSLVISGLRARGLARVFFTQEALKMLNTLLVFERDAHAVEAAVDKVKSHGETQQT